MFYISDLAIVDFHTSVAMYINVQYLQWSKYKKKNIEYIYLINTVRFSQSMLKYAKYTKRCIQYMQSKHVNNTRLVQYLSVYYYCLISLGKIKNWKLANFSFFSFVFIDQFSFLASELPQPIGWNVKAVYQKRSAFFRHHLVGRRVWSSQQDSGSHWESTTAACASVQMLARWKRRGLLVRSSFMRKHLTFPMSWFLLPKCTEGTISGDTLKADCCCDKAAVSQKK